MRIHLPTRTLTAEIAVKSLRKAQPAIHDAGADNVALALQCHLVAGDVTGKAGLSAQPKAAKTDAAMTCAEIMHGHGGEECEKAP